MMMDDELVAIEEAEKALGIKRRTIAGYLYRRRMAGAKGEFLSPTGFRFGWTHITRGSLAEWQERQATLDERRVPGYKKLEAELKANGEQRCEKCGQISCGPLCPECLLEIQGEPYWTQRELEAACSSSLWARCSAAVRV